MNQRIQELAEQAGITLSQKDYSYYWVESAEDIEKFAELIVQECVNVLHDNELWNRHISHAFQEHFGVE